MLANAVWTGFSKIINLNTFNGRNTGEWEFFFFFLQKFGKGEGVNLILCKWKILRDEGL